VLVVVVDVVVDDKKALELVGERRSEDGGGENTVDVDEEVGERREKLVVPFVNLLLDRDKSDSERPFAFCCLVLFFMCRITFSSHGLHTRTSLAYPYLGIGMVLGLHESQKM